MKKNMLLKNAYFYEVRETVLGLALAGFFFAGCITMMWLWIVYGAQLNLSEAARAAFATTYALLIGGVLIRFGGGHAIERGKKAVYYHRALAKCPATARGRR